MIKKHVEHSSYKPLVRRGACVDEDMDAADKRPPWVEPIDKAQAEVLKRLLAQPSFDIGSTVSGGEGFGQLLKAFISG
jgi:hypothetical protein